MIIIYDYLLPSLLLLEKKYLLVITNKPSSCEISELKFQQISEIVTSYLGGGLKDCFINTPTWGNDPI